MRVGVEALRKAASEALSGHICVSGWLGYGNVLFLGFGEASPAGIHRIGSHARPPFELETNFAEWSILSDGSAIGLEDNPNEAEAIVCSLIGLPVTGWSLGARHALQVTFPQDKTLRVAPWSDARYASHDAWSLSLPGGIVLAVSCGGQIARVKESEPISEWFPAPPETP